MRDEDRAGMGVTQVEPGLQEALCKKCVCDICDTGQNFVLPPSPNPWCPPCLAHGKNEKSLPLLDGCHLPGEYLIPSLPPTPAKGNCDSQRKRWYVPAGMPVEVIFPGHQGQC